jgi:hypothetical protein
VTGTTLELLEGRLSELDQTTSHVPSRILIMRWDEATVCRGWQFCRSDPDLVACLVLHPQIAGYSASTMSDPGGESGDRWDSKAT